ncbi:uncharacterized protein LOC123199970 isoform X2 [Mangifera indica]|uniref:uncharacterized protein LOC123199970 isoform X2 n=1 Tax=Mangifera indica TaxID=29780 RepID=UPI001CFA55E1|nr:uncharacterized protein LOC123199970 isoform X2 [Mangifera indica]
MLDFVAMNEVSQEGNLLVQHHLLFDFGGQQQTTFFSWSSITQLRYLMFLLRLCDLDLVDMKTCVFDLIIIYPKMRKMVCFHFWENMLDFVAINEVSQEGNLLVQHHLLFGSGEQQQTASISWGLITQNIEAYKGVEMMKQTIIQG